jgi:hypothetical protein
MFVMMRDARSSTAGASHDGRSLLLALPVGRVLAQDFLQSHRLAEADVHLAEPLAQRRQRAQQSEHGFFLLRLAGQLADVGLAFDQPLVTEVHGHEHHRTARIAQVAAKTSSTACRSSAAAGGQCGCGRLR